MTHKIYRGDDTLLVRFDDGGTLEITNAEWLALADDIIALLRPAGPARYTKWTLGLVETARRMYVDEGKGVVEIGRAVGMSAQSINHKLRRLGIPAHDQKRSAALSARRRTRARRNP